MFILRQIDSLIANINLSNYYTNNDMDYIDNELRANINFKHLQ